MCRLLKLFLTFLLLHISSIVFSQRITEIFKALPNDLQPCPIGHNEDCMEELLKEILKNKQHHRESTREWYKIDLNKKLGYIRLWDGEFGSWQMAIWSMKNGKKLVAIIELTGEGDVPNSYLNKISFFTFENGKIKKSNYNPLPNISWETFIDRNKQYVQECDFSTDSTIVFSMHPSFEAYNNQLVIAYKLFNIEVSCDVNKLHRGEWNGKSTGCFKGNTIIFKWNEFKNKFEILKLCYK